MTHARRTYRVLGVCVIVCGALLVSAHISDASMDSASYSIQSDSVNFGGELGTSTSYSIEDTLGEVATGNSSSASYKLKAGYQQMQEVYVAVSVSGDVTMSPSIGGLSGGTSDGSTIVTVTTDSSAGYELLVKASSSPAMQREGGGGSISDYTPAGASPDLTFSVASTDAEFGFSPEGADIVQRYLDDGFLCDQVGGSDTPDKCWDGLSTTNKTVSQSMSANHPAGTATVLKFRVVSGSSHVQSAGDYTATTTVTAIAL